MQILKLTSPEGEVILVNPRHLIGVVEDEGSVWVKSTDGPPFLVQEDILDIYDMIQAL